MNTAKLNPQSKNYFRALAAVIITGMAAFSMEYCLQPVISKIAATFELNPAQASLAVSAAMIGMALTLFVLTSFADRLPRRKMLAGSLIISSAVLFGVGFTQSFAAVVALRFVQGCILAMVPVLAMAYINEEFDTAKTSFGIGMYVCGTTLGGLSGRIFAAVVSVLFRLNAYDTQCGAKVFAPRVVEEVFHEPFLSHWLFDIEILLRLRNRYANYNEIIHEIPLDVWIEQGNSKIRPLHLLKMPGQLLRIFFKYRKRDKDCIG